MLAMVKSERQNNLDEQLPDVKFSWNKFVSLAMGLSPNEVHIDGLSRLPVSRFERAGVARQMCSPPRPPGKLRLDDGPPTARLRYRLRTPRPHRSSREPLQLRHLQRTASGSQYRSWWLAVDATTRQGATLDMDAKILKFKVPHLTARAPAKSSQLVPAPQWIPARISSRGSALDMILLPACQALMLVSKYRFNAVSTVRPPTAGPR